MTAPEAGPGPGPEIGPDPLTGGVEPSPVDLGRLDLCAELGIACAELHQHAERGDREMADLLGAWIDTLLDEWNRRQA